MGLCTHDGAARRLLGSLADWLCSGNRSWKASRRALSAAPGTDGWWFIVRFHGTAPLVPNPTQQQCSIGNGMHGNGKATLPVKLDLSRTFAFCTTPLDSYGPHVPPGVACVVPHFVLCGCPPQAHLQNSNRVRLPPEGRNERRLVHSIIARTKNLQKPQRKTKAAGGAHPRDRSHRPSAAASGPGRRRRR